MNVVSPLEALKQPPIIRTPQVVQSRPNGSAGSNDSSDDEYISISFPAVESLQSSGNHVPPLLPRSGEPATATMPRIGEANTADSLASVAAAAAAAARIVKKRKKNGKKILHVCLTKYPVIRELADEMNFVMETQDEELEKFDFNMIWSDTVLPLQKLVRLVNWQRTNHFPSMHLLCRKVHLGLTLGRMRKVFPQHYGFFPRTWSMRSEKQQFARHYATLATKKVFILKPNAGCQGKGIIITKDPLSAVEDLDNYVCQEYVMRPLLIEGKKFDLRVYCLVTSINIGLIRSSTRISNPRTSKHVYPSLLWGKQLL